MCTTANPPGAERCFRCEAALDTLAPLSPPRRAQRRQRAVTRPDLSPAQRLRLRAMRILIAATLVFILPLGARYHGFPLDVPPGLDAAAAKQGERMWMSRSTGAIAAGDVVAFGNGVFGTMVGEVIALPVKDVHPARIRIRSGLRFVDVPPADIDGRAVLVYSPLSRLRRLPPVSERPSP